MNDEILAVPVSPAGQGAVALIHVSGPGAMPTVQALLRGTDLPGPGRSRHAWLHDTRGDRLDDALLVVQSPAASYTGHALVEVGIHGGATVLDAVLKALEASGARVGTWKHLLDQGKRTGAVNPLFMAAHRHLARVLSRRGATLLVQALSGELQRILREALENQDRIALQALYRASHQAEAWLRPLRVVLAGPPNAGKSTLFNALLGWERATVSSEAGTTRDDVEEDLLVEDRPLRLVDTAGGRARIGSRPQVRKAGVVVFLGDGTGPGTLDVPPEIESLARKVLVVNKVDRLSPEALARIPGPWIPLSAREGLGLEDLVRAVFTAAGIPEDPGGERFPGPALFTRRDLRLLKSCLDGGDQASNAREELRKRTVSLRDSE